MRQTKFKTILDGVAIKAGVDPSYIPVHERQAFVEAINDRLTWAWEYAPWPEFLNIEERWFRPKWVGATYERGAEVYHDGTDSYYQALTTTVGVPGTSTDWAPLVDRYSVPEWSESTTYLKGAIFIYQEEVYQCYSLMSGGEAVSFVNGGIIGNDPNYFLKLPSVYLNRYIAWNQAGYGAIGTPISLFASNPTQNFQRPIKFVQRSEGISPALEDENPGTSVWVEYRSSPPEFTHVAWDAAATYSVGDKVYHEDTGECYEATASSTGQVPATASTFWSKMQFPAFLAPAVKCLAHAEVLSQEGQQEKMMGMEEKGLLLLVRELDKVESQNDQAKPYAIKPRSRLRTSGSEVAENAAGSFGSVKEGWTPRSGPVWAFEMGQTIRHLGWNRNGTQSLAMPVSFAVTGEGYNLVRRASASVAINFQTTAVGEISVIREGITVMLTGITVVATGTLIPSAAKQGTVLPIAITFAVASTGKNIVRPGSTTIAIGCSVSANAINVVLRGYGQGKMGLFASNFAGDDPKLYKFGVVELRTGGAYPYAFALPSGFSAMSYVSGGNGGGHLLVGERLNGGVVEWCVSARLEVTTINHDWQGIGNSSERWHPIMGGPPNTTGWGTQQGRSASGHHWDGTTASYIGGTGTVNDIPTSISGLTSWNWVSITTGSVYWDLHQIFTATPASGTTLSGGTYRVQVELPTPNALGQTQSGGVTYLAGMTDFLTPSIG